MKSLANTHESAHKRSESSVRDFPRVGSSDAPQRATARFRYTPVVCSQVAPTLDCSYATKQGLDNQHIDGGAGLFVQTAVAFEQRFVRTTGGQPSREVNPCLRADVNAGDGAPCVATGSTVRRLTPRECERLMGFPDDWTRIPWRGKPAEDCPDGPRYKACGNSMGVNVMRWIGRRIQSVESQN